MTTMTSTMKALAAGALIISAAILSQPAIAIDASQVPQELTKQPTPTRSPSR